MTTITKTGGSTAYQFLKYAVYLALLANVFLFLIEEIDSAGALNTSVTGFASFFQIFFYHNRHSRLVGTVDLL